MIEIDDVYPRDAEHRFRLYGRRGEALEVLACAPTAAGIGEAIVTLHQDAKTVRGELGDYGQTGILDAVAGEWIVKPWSRPERNASFGKPETPLG